MDIPPQEEETTKSESFLRERKNLKNFFTRFMVYRRTVLKRREIVFRWVMEWVKGFQSFQLFFFFFGRNNKSKNQVGLLCDWECGSGSG